MSDHLPHGLKETYSGRRVLVTGGLGFIGSTLARRLVDLGAEVLLVDSLIPEYGGNPTNISGYEDRLRVNIADVRGHGMEYLVRGHDVIFNLAAKTETEIVSLDAFLGPDCADGCTIWLRYLPQEVDPNEPGIYIWIDIGETFIATGGGFDTFELTPLSIPVNITIPKEQIYAFQLISVGSESLAFSRAHQSYEEEHIVMDTAYGMNGGGSTEISSGYWHGRIHYYHCTNAMNPP